MSDDIETKQQEVVEQMKRAQTKWQEEISTYEPKERAAALKERVTFLEGFLFRLEEFPLLYVEARNYIVTLKNEQYKLSQQL